ncbi:MAG: MBL fold metallo-hydrolase [Sulfurospirillum sp.]|nr:MBL fold metallo-hydrolase [Sulfurospirillum sp.]
MKILQKPMGLYQTNCYIVQVDGKDLIIDPGVGATKWVLEHAKNPIAILNTHGHFDHVWSNKELQEKLNVPLYIPIDDAFMLANDPFSQGTPVSIPDVLVEDERMHEIDGIRFSYLHFAGHTPGCSGILIGENLFSGDFLFKGSIGRVDFPYSDPQAMKKSIKKFLRYTENWKIYPGHGGTTTSHEERKTLPRWLEYI